MTTIRHFKNISDYGSCKKYMRCEYFRAHAQIYKLYYIIIFNLYNIFIIYIYFYYKYTRAFIRAHANICARMRMREEERKS